MSNPLQEWICKPLDGFKIESCSEVYRMNEDGERIGASSVLFRDATIARVYRDQSADSNFYRIREVLVLTSTYTGVLIGDLAISFVDEDVLNDLRRKALEKLSEDERALLGL